MHARHEKARAHWHVLLDPADDGMCILTALIPAQTALGAYNRVDRIVRDINGVSNLRIDQLLHDYMVVQYPTHKYFVSVMGHVTAATDAGWTAGAERHTRLGSETNYGIATFFTRRASGDTEYPTASSRRLGHRSDGALNNATAIGPLHQNIGIASTVTGTAYDLFRVGNTLASMLGKGGSKIFYRAQIEDLTVSGRSYEQADAATLAVYTREFLTPGGRYYGDTYTAPTTFAP